MPFKYSTLAELTAERRPAVEWVVHEIVPKQGITFLVAKPGAGKSLLAYDMATCVALGTPWLGTIPTQMGAVMYVDLDGRGGLASGRAHAAIRGQGCDDAIFDHLPLNIAHSYSIYDVRESEKQSELLQACASIPDLALVIFDTYADIHRGEENSPDDMLDTMYSLLAVAQSLSCGVLIIHHLRKSASGTELDDVRGSSAIIGKADAVFLLRQQRDTPDSSPRLTLLQRKARLTAEAPARDLVLTAENDATGNLYSYRFTLTDAPTPPAGSQGGRPTDHSKEDAMVLLAEYTRHSPDAPRADLVAHLTSKGFSRSTAYSATAPLFRAPPPTAPPDASVSVQNPPQG